MKLLLWAAAALTAAFGLWATPSESKNHVLIIGGGTAGYLAPCGCTSPMSGGIKRRAAAVKAHYRKGHTTVLESGPLAGAFGRQSELKLEALAEAMKSMNVSAASFSWDEAQLGPGLSAAAHRLSGGVMVASRLEEGGLAGFPKWKSSGPFLIGSIDSRAELTANSLSTISVAKSNAINNLVEQAEADQLVPILMIDGNRAEAAAFADEYSAIKVIVYRSNTAPRKTLDMHGGTALVSPGDHGKHMLRMEWDGKKVVGYTDIDLGPEWKDDSAATEIYMSYQQRVEEEGLIELVPRTATDSFAGSEACLTCHPAAAKAWSGSAHSAALITLRKTGHDKDPDCVGCHVVGLDSTEGFQSFEKTPALAHVGCESCHGPSKKHADNPVQSRTPAVAQEACANCHTPDHSPEFDFTEYWRRIIH